MNGDNGHTMLCPYCLTDTHFRLVRIRAAALSEEDSQGSAIEAVDPGDRNARYRCANNECQQYVPSMYVTGYHEYPPVVANAVGFSQHGKSVYFASLLHALRHEQLSGIWENYYTLALDDDSLRAVMANREMLERGELPAATPKNFMRPTLMRLHGIPAMRDCTLALYDVGGEAFDTIEDMGEYARFVARAHTVFFLVSIPRLVRGAAGRNADERAQVADGMFRLLERYIAGMSELKGNTRAQDLVVVYSMADVLTRYISDGCWPELRAYLGEGSFQGLEDTRGYCRNMAQISLRLHEFTERGIRARAFLAAARDHFQSLRFTMVSALGAPPDEGTNRLRTRVAPCRVLDPLLMLLGRASCHGAAPSSSPRTRRGISRTILKWFGRR